MPRKLALIVSTAAVTTVVNYKLSMWRYDKAEAVFRDSATEIGNTMYRLGQVHGTLAAQRAMMNARPIVEDRQYVSHTMN